MRYNILRRLAHDYDDVGEQLLKLAAMAKERQPTADDDELLERVRSAVEEDAYSRSKKITIICIISIIIGTGVPLYYITIQKNIAYSKYLEEHQKDPDVNHKEPSNIGSVQKPESNDKNLTVPLPNSPIYQIDPNAGLNNKVLDLSEHIKLLEEKWRRSVEYNNFYNKFIVTYVFVIPAVLVVIIMLWIRLDKLKKTNQRREPAIVTGQSIGAPLTVIEKMTVRFSARLRISYYALLTVIVFISIGFTAIVILDLFMDNGKSAAVLGTSGAVMIALTISRLPLNGARTEDDLLTKIRTMNATFAEIQDAVERTNAEWKVVRDCLNETFPTAPGFPSDAPRSIAKRRAKRAFDVFLCHNSQDKPAVKTIARQLIQADILPWFDEWELRPGMEWGSEIDAELHTVHAAAVFVGPSGIGPWQSKELYGLLERCVERTVPVIPVLLVDQPPPKLPVLLAGMTWVDMTKSDPDPVTQLVWGICGTRKGRRRGRTRRRGG